MFQNDSIALVLTFAAALAWLKINDIAADKGWLEAKLSRKLIHIGTGPIFVLCWLLFSNQPSSRYLAAIVPLVITVQFFLTGLGVIKAESTVNSMSRTGDRREILQGPVYYGIIFVILTILFLYDSPIGVIALMALCGGDGLADIIGRRFGKAKIPWSASKSWIGSLGMFVGSWVLSVLIIWSYSLSGIFSAPIETYILPITLISLGATIIESLPLKEIDNITITLAALALGHLLI